MVYGVLKTMKILKNPDLGDPARGCASLCGSSYSVWECPSVPPSFHQKKILRHRMTVDDEDVRCNTFFTRTNPGGAPSPAGLVLVTKTIQIVKKSKNEGAAQDFLAELVSR